MQYDNIDFTFKPLCLYKDEYMGLTLTEKEVSINDARKEARWNEICQDSVTGDLVDPYPVFNVKDPYFNFNITGSTSFEGIKFSGAEAAQRYDSTLKHYPTVN